MKKNIPEHQKLYNTLINDEKIKRLSMIKQHRGSNTYFHVLKVCKTAYKMARNLKLKVDFNDLILGAILHDYYLYDWRVGRDKMKNHLKNHPQIALKNAKQDFNIDSKVENIITTHMWPINLTKVNKSIEAFLVSLADKYVCIKEAFTSKKYKERRLNQTTFSLQTIY